jgi:hypothetical protein
MQQARDLLAPVYGWFTEGFDTRDPKEAKGAAGGVDLSLIVPILAASANAPAGGLRLSSRCHVTLVRIKQAHA